MTDIISIVPLSCKVLAVATRGAVGDWAAYIDAVRGQNHFKEAQDVADNGTKLSQELATLIFPEIAKSYRWRS